MTASSAEDMLREAFWALEAQLTSSNHRGDNPGEMGDTLVPVDLNGSVPIQIQSEGTLVCTLSTAHEVKCWGGTGRRELGQGDMITRGENSSTMGANLLPVDIQW